MNTFGHPGTRLISKNNREIPFLSNFQPSKIYGTMLKEFTRNGFVKIEQAFPRELALRAQDILWQATGVDKNNPASWTQPVIRIGERFEPEFKEAANTEKLHQAYDLLVGKGNWLPRQSMGTFPVRFPSDQDPGDDGWHIDVSFPGEDPGNFFSWRSNAASRGRALLMLFLFSDVSEDDAPTRIRVGSHQAVGKLLLPYGEDGLSFMELAQAATAATEGAATALATGNAGDVYLCHPFLLHAAQPHHGKNPRFMAQPPLFPKGDLPADSPVLQAITG